MNKFWLLIALFLLSLANCDRHDTSVSQENEEHLPAHDYEFTEVIGEKGPESTEEFIELLNSKRTSDRRVAAFFLWQLGDISRPGFVPALEQALGDKDRQVRIMALCAIGTHGISELLPKVRTIVLTDADVEVAAFDCLAMMPSSESIPVVNELLERKKSSVEFREKNPNRKEDSAWWEAYGELTLQWIIEGIENLGADNFLSQQDIDTSDHVKAPLLFYAMAWTGNRSYLRHAWPILENVREGGKASPLYAAEFGAIYAVRRLATYEEAKPYLEPLLNSDPMYRLKCELTLRYLKWKEQ